MQMQRRVTQSLLTAVRVVARVPQAARLHSGGLGT